jgi:hypothetical protein
MNAGMIAASYGREPQTEGIRGTSERQPRVFESIETKLRANGQDLAGLVSRLEGLADRIYGDGMAGAKIDKGAGPMAAGNLSSLRDAIDAEDALLKRLFDVTTRLEGL